MQENIPDELLWMEIILNNDDICKKIYYSKPEDLPKVKKSCVHTDGASEENILKFIENLGELVQKREDTKLAVYETAFREYSAREYRHQGDL